jgi:hypothetical protein
VVSASGKECYRMVQLNNASIVDFRRGGNFAFSVVRINKLRNAVAFCTSFYGHCRRPNTETPAKSRQGGHHPLSIFGGV